MCERVTVCVCPVPRHVDVGTATVHVQCMLHVQTIYECVLCYYYCVLNVQVSEREFPMVVVISSAVAGGTAVFVAIGECMKRVLH